MSTPGTPVNATPGTPGTPGTMTTTPFRSPSAYRQEQEQAERETEGADVKVGIPRAGGADTSTHMSRASFRPVQWKLLSSLGRFRALRTHGPAIALLPLGVLRRVDCSIVFMAHSCRGACRFSLSCCP